MSGREAMRSKLLIAVLAGLGLVVATGCTATVAGHGALAAADDPTDDPTVEPTDDPTVEPTDDPTSGDPGGGDVTRDADARASAVCQLYGDGELVELFGGPVELTVPYSSNPSCRFTMAGGSSDDVDVTVYPDYDATKFMFDSAVPITIGGHPGLEDSITTSVSLGADVNQPGCPRGDNFFSFEKVDQGHEIVRQMVEKAVGEFATS